jgi:hypothetical protein
MHAARTPYLEVINKILRYLKGTPEKGIFMRNNNTNKIYGYSNVDRACSFD